ncbi:MAG TPA: magnesium transporter CorA family protein [Terriglobia bacterium]|nr:magnesium transporter CorA family protein [Terriglobia bacterium]
MDQALLDSIAVIPQVRWFHFSDPFSVTFDALAAHFGIHPLQVEDCRHRRQTARLEEHEKYTFIVIKTLVTASGEKRSSRTGPTVATGEQPANPHSSSDSSQPRLPEGRGNGGHLRFDDFDIFLGPDYLLTVSEGASPLVSSVIPRITAEAGLQNPDRIAHALIDSAVDRYLPALDHLGDFINRLEDRVIRNPAPPTLREIFRLKRTLLDFRRVATAMREAVNGLVRRYDAPLTAEGRHIDRELRIYYRDVYDHVVRVIDFIETYRDLLTGSLDIYLSAVANRTNEVMKILTLWGTIAMPLLVLTSFYGMNVELPFQRNPHALAALGGIMAASTVAIFIYIRRKHWF